MVSKRSCLCSSTTKNSKWDKGKPKVNSVKRKRMPHPRFMLKEIRRLRSSWGHRKGILTVRPYPAKHPPCERKTPEKFSVPKITITNESSSNCDAKGFTPRQAAGLSSVDFMVLAMDSWRIHKGRGCGVFLHS